MTEIAQKIYDHFKTEKLYSYSQDCSIKILETKAIEELETNGFINVKIKTIGYVIADIV